MTEIVCAAIAALATIICAFIASKDQKRKKRTEERAEQRRVESHLALQMMAANTELTVGVAMALKNGKCNGEVEDGLKAVEASRKAYREFLENAALDVIKV